MTDATLLVLGVLLLLWAAAASVVAACVMQHCGRLEVRAEWLEDMVEDREDFIDRLREHYGEGDDDDDGDGWKRGNFDPSRN